MPLRITGILRRAKLNPDRTAHRGNGGLMDALSETLRVVQLVGAIFINARFTAPWCYRSPSAAAAAPILEPGAAASAAESVKKAL
jgi:hypothetical protein